MGDVPSLTLTLQESQNIVGPDGALHVTDDGAAGVVEELNANLGDTSTRTSPAEDLCKSSQDEGVQGFKQIFEEPW